MDYFGDSNLFEDCFNSGHVSLADELDLGSGFDPLQLNAVDPEKHPGMVAGSMPSANQHGVDYHHQIGQFDGMKAQTSMAQSFPNQGGGDGGVAGVFINKQSHFQDPTMNQAPQTNGLYPNTSPIWGERRANAYHQQRLQHQQIQQHQQQRHKEHLHQQQFQEQFQHRQGQRHQHQFNQQHSHLQQGQQVLSQHQLSAQHQMPHQQINPHTLCPKSYPDHSNFYYQGNVTSHQGHHGAINSEGSPFHPGVDPQSKSYLNVPMIAATSQQQSGFEMAQTVQRFHGVPVTEESNLRYHVQSSPAAYTLSSCSASMASSYPSSQYSFPGQPPPVVTSSQPRSTMPPGSENVPRNSSCLFMADPLMEQRQKGSQVQVPGNHPQECPFRSLQPSKPVQDAYGAPEIFSEGLASFSAANGPFLHETQNNHGVTGSGFQGLDDVSLLDHQHGGIVAIGEGHNILEEELLPELEAFVQEETTGWNNRRHDEEPRGNAVNDLKGEEDVDFKGSLTLHYKAQKGGSRRFDLEHRQESVSML
ncbi:chromodomain-helicase-DNA-binding protein 9 isoform X1 [Tachysurus ichikawai]